MKFLNLKCPGCKVSTGEGFSLSLLLFFLLFSVDVRAAVKSKSQVLINSNSK